MPEYPRDEGQVEENQDKANSYLSLIKLKREQMNIQSASAQDEWKESVRGRNLTLSHRGVKVVDGDANNVYTDRKSEDGLNINSPAGDPGSDVEAIDGTKPPTIGDGGGDDRGEEQ